MKTIWTTELIVATSLCVALVIIVLGLLIIIRRKQSLLHQKELVENQLKTQLENERLSEQNLKTQWLDCKDELTEARAVLEDLRQKHYDTITQLEVAQADSRSKDKQLEDIGHRLTLADNELKQEREQVSRLKEALAEEGKKSESLNSKLEEAHKNLDDQKLSLVAERQSMKQLQSTYQQLIKENTQLKTEQDEREASHVRELATFEKQKESLVEQFKLLSNEILDAKTKALQENGKLTLSSVMSPFQQSIDSFKKEIQDIHHRETIQQGELRKELESLKALNQKITTEAHELSTALRGQKKLQGNWGELVLENVLDRSGLQLGKDYRREVRVNTEEGYRRPDAVVYLPQQKHLIIDAKVSLNAYTRYVNADDKLSADQALKDHVQAIEARIKELANRDYYKLSEFNSPEMVFMFIPIESAFVEALKADETLFQKAIENNVLVATPTTLLTSLNIVRQLWRYEDQNKHTVALANKAEAVFNKLNTFLGSFHKVKKGLEVAGQAYGEAEKQLISGKGNLVKQVSEFKDLAPRIKAELPSYFTEKASLEIDFGGAEDPASQEKPDQKQSSFAL